VRKLSVPQRSYHRLRVIHGTKNTDPRSTERYPSHGTDAIED
jgi:hypothetical protein